MTEQWQELKETIIEMRDNGGTGAQQEVCKFLANYMEILEKQTQQSCEDCISREATIEAIYKKYIGGKDAIENAPINDLYAEGLVEAVDAVWDMPSVTPKAEQKAVLGKIRAEIEQITDTMGVSYNQYVSKIDVLQIIDKYKADKEDKE